MAGTGGKRAGAGRKPGQRNKATADVKAYAQKHSKAAIEKLYKLMNDRDTPAATQRAAANDLLDRAYGKPAQSVMNEDGTKLFPDNIKITYVSPKSGD